MLTQKYRFETISSLKINFEQKRERVFQKTKTGYISYRKTKPGLKVFLCKRKWIKERDFVDNQNKERDHSKMQKLHLYLKKIALRCFPTWHKNTPHKKIRHQTS